MAGLLQRLLGRTDETALPLYNAVVARARAPHWYLDGTVADTVEGRFEMVAAVLSVALIRLEAEPAGAGIGGGAAARLAERFVDDMDAQLRQQGIGDIVVGKHVGRMMAALGGRLGAYREGLAGGDLDAALRRNLYRGKTPAPAALAHVGAALRELHEQWRAVPAARLIEGEMA